MFIYKLLSSAFAESHVLVDCIFIFMSQDIFQSPCDFFVDLLIIVFRLCTLQIFWILL